MRFNCSSRGDRIAQKSEWHRYFAWFPIQVGPNDCRWLETIERKGNYFNSFEPFWSWEYRPHSYYMGI